jgi:hypothetical protein
MTRNSYREAGTCSQQAHVELDRGDLACILLPYEEAKKIPGVQFSPWASTEEGQCQRYRHLISLIPRSALLNLTRQTEWARETSAYYREHPIIEEIIQMMISLRGAEGDRPDSAVGRSRALQARPKGRVHTAILHGRCGLTVSSSEGPRITTLRGCLRLCRHPLHVPGSPGP